MSAWIDKTNWNRMISTTFLVNDLDYFESDSKSTDENDPQRLMVIGSH